DRIPSNVADHPVLVGILERRIQPCRLRRLLRTSADDRRLFGGLQAQRDFALRPDLITAPLATIGGSAAVPSTVDVYVNNIKT
ncbi:hypothetical protein, partial [Bradyrhizobium uaiense]